MRKADARLIEEAKALKLPAGYDIGMQTLIAIVEMFNNNLSEGFGLVYDMGYIKGQRAAKKKGGAK